MPTYPGFHPDLKIESYPSKIQAAIWKIGENFYVTKSFNSINIGNSEYWAVLVRPTDEFSVYINTDREVLVIFSEYNTFEIRTLEAYEEFYNLLESKRIDKSVRFLISKDIRIEDSVRHYLDQHPEYPIIIPTTFDHLFERGADPLLRAIRRNYLIRDLFAYQNPLREETFFFGRQEVVNSVLDMAKSGQNSGLFGLRKSGKTSAIYAIQRKAKGFSLNVVVIDCQNPAVHSRKYGELLGFILSEVRKVVGLKKITFSLGSDPAEISESFFLHMNNIISNVKNGVLIVFDEVENISPKTAASAHWRIGDDTLLFWQIIRSYIQSESQGKISISIFGTNPYILEAPKINDVANPMYLYAQKRFIPSLSFDDTREMVERLGYFMGLEFPPEIIANLQQEFGGHPFFTRQVCSKIHQIASVSRPVRVSLALLSRAKTEFQGQLEQYLRDIVEHLRDNYFNEFCVLRAVVEGDKSELTEYGNEAPDLIDHLIGYGVVERRGEDFDIRFDAIKSILQRLVSSNSESRWAEISRRRNDLEVSIRIALYHWSRNVSAEQWHEVLSSSLTGKRFDGLTTTEPSALFSSRESPLYLSDLLGFLKNERVLVYLGARRSQIVRYISMLSIDCARMPMQIA
ncbi:hypothetical protein A4A59_013235 [Rhizobium leguminosarum]|uniref:Uncharacterized protein n=1 Tax=Rhizobium leguminosarum TaxID=384 RepID=A0ACD5EYC7_RHILE|nr:hypothetical protein [Rhizobium leguminosarum]